MSQIASIETLTGSNFKKWNEHIRLVLGVMDIDYALRVDKPTPLSNTSTQEEKSAYEKWERSNRLSLMIMKGSISSDIRGDVPDSENAKDFLNSVEEQFQSSSKALATTLIIKMDKRHVKKNNDGNKAKTSCSKTRKYNFCRELTHFQKDCPKFKEWLAKKGKMSSYVCYESFLANVPTDTWWIDSGASVQITYSS
ncbi:hypothetical protein ZIOFF_043585 [Zingiber officinale]|uniref:Uncharacterized protein n=1 Tax=Zingiber officinale TaxID=94328 RepID=A0A8J5KQK1_ZINOF|nr:hypothetical protein ZIOFF_043585 [Zingiber officinale]